MKHPDYRYQLWDVTDGRLIESFVDSQSAKRYSNYCNEKSKKEKVYHLYKVLDKESGKWK